MDKNRVVTFGSLGGQSTPSSLSGVVNTGGYIFKGYYPSGVSDNTRLKYLYYGYAVGDNSGSFYVPVFNTNDTTYFFEATLSAGSFSIENLLKAIGNFDGGRAKTIQYSTIASLSENSPKMDVFTLFEQDENGEFVEALDENGDPIYYAEEHVDDDLNS